MKFVHPIGREFHRVKRIKILINDNEKAPQLFWGNVTRKKQKISQLLFRSVFILMAQVLESHRMLRILNNRGLLHILSSKLKANFISAHLKYLI